MASRSLIPPVGRPRALALAALLLASCAGWSTQRLTDFPAARTIAVRPFDNLGFRRDLELRLTRAVTEEVRARTSLALTTPDKADLVLSGRMQAEETPVVLDENGQVIQKRLLGWLQVQVVERATGRVVRQRRVATHAEWLEGAPGQSLQGSATDEWVRRIAEKVAQTLERSF
jgi:hypothetical protein